MTTPWFERLSGLDAAFLSLEDSFAHLHLGALGIFEGSAPSYRELVAHVGSRLSLAPRLRQRLERVPFGVGRPVWVDAVDFQLEFHLRHAALPAPGDDEALARFISSLLAQPLARARPPWEVWLIDGLRGGRFALLWKMHHCMVDGVAGLSLARVALDVRSTPARPPPAPLPWRPRATPSASQLLTDSLRELGRYPLAWGRRAVSRSPEGSKARLEVLARAGPFAALARIRRAPRSTLNEGTGSARRFEMAAVDLAESKRIAARFGFTVNDVLLATVAAGFRAVLAERGEPIPHALQVMVPVDVRTDENRGAAGNRVAAMFCPLPVGEPAPMERLKQTAAAMGRLKGQRQALGTLTLLQMADLVPPAVVAFITRRSVLHWFNAVVTNVPGPDRPLYLLGRKLQAWFPVVPLAPGTSLGVAALSYAGSIGIGVLADAEAEASARLLARAIPRAFEELRADASESSSTAEAFGQA